nr:CsgG/HfaB family protein [uncultured Dyadobacter sp.]
MILPINKSRPCPDGFANRTLVGILRNRSGKTPRLTNSIVLPLLLLVFLPVIAIAQKKGDKGTEITLEQVTQKCKDLPREQRVVIKVARFSVSTKTAAANTTFGDELATMLTSALHQTNCFRVMETNKNLSDATSEIRFEQDGFTGGSGPQAGQMLGAQLIVTGEITDFSEGSSSKSIMGVESRSNRATVGFTLKVLNPQTGELLFSRDVNMQGHNSGKVLDIFGVRTSSTNENRAVQDATQKAIIKAVEILADEKDRMEIPEPQKPKEIKRYTAQNCALLRSSSPKVIILVTEATTEGTTRLDDEGDFARREQELYVRRQEAITTAIHDMFKGKNRKNRQEEKTSEPTTTQTAATAQIKKVVIEQSATETELTRHFVDAGFKVVDPKIYGKMKQLSDSTGDLAQMAALGLKMGANVIITGQAISEKTNAQGGMIACRARLEIRVIATDDGSILASNTISAGGIDVSEAVANKVALRNASEGMSQYLLERLCSMNTSFGPTTTPKKTQAAVAARVASQMTSEIQVSNVNYAKLSAMATGLGKHAKVKGIKKSIKGTEGVLAVEHTGSTDELVENLSKIPALKFEVLEMEEGKAIIKLP